MGLRKLLSEAQPQSCPVVTAAPGKEVQSSVGRIGLVPAAAEGTKLL